MGSGLKCWNVSEFQWRIQDFLHQLCVIFKLSDKNYEMKENLLLSGDVDAGGGGLLDPPMGFSFVTLGGGANETQK